ncbi:DUF5107 domain-containing protein [Vallitalea guaymasensis]|uniref:DUF5107 domain-containing protein n=1 Tax=Vallitalea guaymasensis TaxID=1185412 RepID=A0A8J8MAC1_9FIRM|nr:DUF5107 domain-containing protein [Vallitalea guaymasensis]QUH29256.1 DUF5107 domain-containing protein [Vallitalea guaymasensis]
MKEKLEIYESNYRNAKSIHMSNNLISCTILPELGGKIASFYHKDKKFELLFQNKKDEYMKPDMYDDFSLYDASGFDDCFPSVDEGFADFGSEKIKYPDHGEIWSSCFDYEIIGDRVKLKYASRLLPYTYEKSIGINENTILIDYKIKNTGSEVIDCFYTMHCLINCEKNIILKFPSETKEVINVLESSFLGKKGSIHPFPVTQTNEGKSFFLDHVKSPDSNGYEKYYVMDKIEDGICGAYYPSKGIEFVTKYDATKLPYLGFWVTEGGFRGDYNCALEPSNGFYDSMKSVYENNKFMKLEPNTDFEFSIELSLTSVTD